MGNTVANAEAMLKIKYGKEPPTHVVRLDSQRYLTAGEISLAKLIFKDAIEYSKVLIKRGGLAGLPNKSNNAMTPFGKIHLPEKSYISVKDFSLSKQASDRIDFFHKSFFTQFHVIDSSN